MLPYLKNCVRSVQDQNSVAKEHIVVDGISTDGTLEWLRTLRTKNRLKLSSGKDKGMYDALNKGFRMAQGQILACLNCDEQYLPGTLTWVKAYFSRHKDVDVLFGDSLLIRPDGSLVAYWKGYKPIGSFILSSYLYVLTCTMFFRRKIVDDGVYMNPAFKLKGDAEFVVRLLRLGYTLRHERRYLAAFTMTGKNLSLDERAKREKRLLRQQFPDFPYRWAWFINLGRLAHKLTSGAYFQPKPLHYSVYTDEHLTQRKMFNVRKATFRWRNE